MSLCNKYGEEDRENRIRETLGGIRTVQARVKWTYIKVETEGLQEKGHVFRDRTRELPGVWAERIVECN